MLCHHIFVSVRNYNMNNSIVLLYKTYYGPYRLYFSYLLTKPMLDSFSFLSKTAASLLLQHLAAEFSALGQDLLEFHKLPEATLREQNWIDGVCWPAETLFDLLQHNRVWGLGNLLYLYQNFCSRPSHIPPASSSFALQSNSAGANMTDQRSIYLPAAQTEPVTELS